MHRTLPPKPGFQPQYTAVKLEVWYATNCAIWSVATNQRASAGDMQKLGKFYDESLKKKEIPLHALHFYEKW